MLRWGRMLRLLLVALLVALVILLGIVPIVGAYLHVNFLIDQPCGNQPTPLSASFPDPARLEAVQLRPAGQAFLLDGWLARGDNGAAVILLGGAWGGRDNLPDEMRLFHQAGYTVFTFDTRSCAEPPQQTSLGYAEVADMQAALDFIARQPEVNPAKIGVYGHSAGGVTAMLTAAQDDRIRALAVSGAYSDLAADIRGSNPTPLERWIRVWVEFFYEWRTGVDVEAVRPVRVVDALSPRPLLLIYGSEEVAGTGGQALFDAARAPKTLWIVQGAGHGDYMAVAPDEFRRRLTDFFNEALLHDTG